MKILHILCAALMVVATSSCETDNLTHHESLLLQGWELHESGEYYFRFLTDEELENSRYQLDGTSKTRTCQWNDGQAGSITCEGPCRVVVVLDHTTDDDSGGDGNTNDETQLCIKCQSSGDTGACREYI